MYLVLTLTKARLAANTRKLTGEFSSTLWSQEWQWQREVLFGSHQLDRLMPSGIKLQVFYFGSKTSHVLLCIRLLIRSYLIFSEGGWI